VAHRALLGLGSNIGDRIANLATAVDAIADVAAVSPVYETDPVGITDQDPFLNLVVELRTDMGPRELLEVCRELEAVAGRLRRVRWGPRSLDVDVLWVDGHTASDPDLTVPHPRMFDRAFVLVPLADLAADILPDGYDVAGAASAEGVRKLGSLDSLR